MSKPPILTPALLALLLGTAVPATAADEKSEQFALILIDGQNNHDWRGDHAAHEGALEETGRFTVDVASNLKPDDKPGRVRTPCRSRPT